jgi:hypothetical protein
MADTDLDEALNRFRFHPAGTVERQRAHEDVRNVCAGALRDLWVLVPASPERDRMVDALDGVCMLANAAVARHGK